MWARSLASAALIASSLLSTVSAADLDPIVIKGSKFFFKSNGTQFFMRGVAYQASPTNSTSGTFIDPLADEAGCKRDIPLLQELGTNTIRVYAINTTSDHSPCMKLLNDAGIYVISDLSEPRLSINRNSPEWDDRLFERYASVVDALAPYSNVLGFFAGNEVSNESNNTNASPFVKAAIRDMKAYIKRRNYRAIPLGYATNDDQKIRSELADYFNCGSSSESADFWGYNIYSWCGNSSYTESGYDQRTKEFENYSIPSFFAEYGCNVVQPRVFTEVGALFGSQMTPVFSGGIVYMYHQEANDYGLVEIGSSGTATKLVDYNNLKSELAKVSPSGVQSNSYTPANTAARSCPTADSNWSASTVLPPTPNRELCSCMVSSLSCVAATKVREKDTGDLFNYICGEAKTDCAGITANGTTGEYGAYSMCSPLERVSWAMNAYYVKQKKASDACNFDGSAKTQTAATASGTCKSLLSEAGGTAGTGTVTSSPNSSGTGTKGAAVGLTIPAFQVGAVKIGAGLLAAALGGAALVFV
ncbi:Glycoside Hydrolase Family 72 [Tuber magnatum]|uniref:1,3-beta-glucanosyltransferase n=1 Tax=Tuber magnatum TaxID=42249 RepID=A0A317SCT7_9PEZI|nr:Glycoside Hydrolase Family 72 [Tuber magnatum]